MRTGISPSRSILPSSPKSCALLTNSGPPLSRGRQNDMMNDSPIKILLIEDNPGDARLIKPMLEQAHNELAHRVVERTAELQRSKALLAEGKRISHTGSWSWHVPTGKLVWSEEHYRVFGFEPGEVEPTISLFLERIYPEDRPVV